MAEKTVPHSIFRSEARRRVQTGPLNLVHREALTRLFDAIELFFLTGIAIPEDLRAEFAKTVAALSHPAGRGLSGHN